VPSSSHCKLHKFGAEKSISWAKPAHFHFFSINFSIWSHILSTVGDALRASPWVLSIGPCTLQSDGEKLKFAGLDRENGFLCMFAELGKKVQQSCAPARGERNKYDLTAAPCF
jgi:hypothetical protein